MAANGISELSTKQLRQEAKLAKATAKRQGKVVAVDGTISGSVDDTKPYYRIANTLDITLLPTKYNGNGITDNPNVGGLADGRPWTTTPAGVVDTLGFFENQLVGGTYMTFNETIAGVTVQAITTNFNGNPTFGSYIKINGTVIASDWFTSPDGLLNGAGGGVGFHMTRGHTITILDPVTATSRAGFPKCYDTYGGAGLAAAPTAGIANDIKNAAEGDIIVMGTYDATSCSAAMRNAMTAYTGANTYTNTWSAVRTSHMFLAKRKITSTYGSGLFSSSSLSVTYTTGLSFGSSDFTMEAWIYPTGAGANRRFFSQAVGSPITQQCLRQTSGNKLHYFFNEAGNGLINITGSTNLNANAWNHCAIVRSGSTFTLYQNGVSVATGTYAGSLPDMSTAGLLIGASNAGVTENWAGYISNYRIVKGTAVYTGSYTVPYSPFTATQSANPFGGSNTSAITSGQTQLLLATYTDAAITTDTSGNGVTVTNSGVTTDSLNPFV